MPRYSLAGCFTDGLCHIDQRTGRFYIPMCLYRSLPVVAWTFFLEDILLVIACRNPFSDSLCSLGGRGLCTRRTVFVDLMLEENTGRFMGKMSYGSHENPIWYNFLTVIWGWIPWTLVLLISLFGLKWKTCVCYLRGHLSANVSGKPGKIPFTVALAIVHMGGNSLYFHILLHPQE